MVPQTIRKLDPEFRLQVINAWISQVIKFAVVGIINTGIDLGIYFLLTRYVSFFGDFVFLAKAFSYSIGVVTSYALNRNWTFKSNTASMHSFFPFIGVNLVSVALNTVLLILFLDFLRIQEGFALVLVTGSTFVWNFLASKILVFKGSETTRVSESKPILWAWIPPICSCMMLTYMTGGWIFPKVMSTRSQTRFEMSLAGPM